jgi:hypothetical protein
MNYLEATLSYTCSCGRKNHLIRHFSSHNKPITHVNLMPYLPREWPCSSCRTSVPAYVEVSVRWLDESEAEQSGKQFDSIDPSGKFTQ